MQNNTVRGWFRHGQGHPTLLGIHHFGASTKQNIFYLFVLLFYTDTLENQVHNIYDSYAFYSKYPNIAHFPNVWERTNWKVSNIRNFSSYFLRKWGDQVLKVDH